MTLRTHPCAEDTMRAARRTRTEVAAPSTPIRLDFGCGPHKREGFIGVDQSPFVGVDVVCDLASERWPWADGTVSEGHASHFLEHLTATERVHFWNELYRVLAPGGSCQIIVPHWASNRAYGDPTHQWPPVSEMAFYYISQDWRAANAPHTDAAWNPKGFSCDFDATWGYSMRPDLLSRNAEYQQYALANHKDAAMDLIATVRKKG